MEESVKADKPGGLTAKRKAPKKIAHLKDLHADPMNARKHGERNIGMLSKSLEEYGAARSIVIDEDGQIIAGHGVVEAAGDIGITKVIPVEASGNEIIAVVRRGLTAKQKQELALADNRVAELAEWDPAILASLSEKADLGKFWSEKELAELLASETPLVHMKHCEPIQATLEGFRVLSEYECGRAQMAIEWVARAQKPIVEIGGRPVKDCDFLALAHDLNQCVVRSGESVTAFIIPDRIRRYCCYGFYRYRWAIDALLATWGAGRWSTDPQRWRWLQGLLFGYSAEAIQRFISSASHGQASSLHCCRRSQFYVHRRVEIYGPLVRLLQLSRHYRGYDSRDHDHKSLGLAARQREVREHRGQQREFACPGCSQVFKKDLDFKVHWKEAHTRKSPDSSQNPL
jgi:uncharacterized C2H2 Zn-finger protein